MLCILRRPLPQVWGRGGGWLILAQSPTEGSATEHLSPKYGGEVEPGAEFRARVRGVNLPHPRASVGHLGATNTGGCRPTARTTRPPAQEHRRGSPSPRCSRTARLLNRVIAGTHVGFDRVRFP